MPVLDPVEINHIKMNAIVKRSITLYKFSTRIRYVLERSDTGNFTVCAFLPVTFKSLVNLIV